MIVTLMIFGSVRYCLHVPWPPPSALTPLFSTITWNKLFAKTPAPAVKESPIAAITSMSPGRSLCTETGTSCDLPPEIYRQNTLSLQTNECHTCYVTWKWNIIRNNWLRCLRVPRYLKVSPTFCSCPTCKINNIALHTALQYGRGKKIQQII